MCRYFKRVSGVGSGNYVYFWKSSRGTSRNVIIVVEDMSSFTKIDGKKKDI